MITHIVLVKLRDCSTENIENTRLILLSMKGKVSMLRDIEVGVDLLHTDRSYDLALIAKFDSLVDLEDYQNDSYHQIIKKHLLLVMEKSATVDFQS